MRILTFLCLFIAITSSHAFTLNADYKNGWRGPTLKFNVNQTNCPAGILSALGKAVDLWNTVSTSYLTLETGRTDSTTTAAALVAGTASDSPVIVCENNFNAVTSQDEDAVAGVGSGSVTGADGNYINFGGVILNTSSGDASVNNMNGTQLAVVLAHEIGHALGFGHSSDDAALMYYDASYKTELSLSQDDWDALTYLYPRDELDGDDLLGCGFVKNTQPPSTWLLLFFTLPLLFLLSLSLKLRLRRFLFRFANGSRSRRSFSFGAHL